MCIYEIPYTIYILVHDWLHLGYTNDSLAKFKSVKYEHSEPALSGKCIDTY